MKIAIILGTRPEIIKLSPVIRECINRNLDYFIIHTNQHYSKNMDEIFFEDLELPKCKYNLGIGSGSQGEQTGKMMIELEKVLISEKPSVAIVQGDTNSVLAGALVASKLGIRIAHVEAGLRSYDRTMPEEINRILTDHLSDYLLVPTESSKNIVLNEGISSEKIFSVGNTIVDSVFENLKLAENKSEILKKINLSKNNYFLATLHRPSNVDNKKKLSGILEAFGLISSKYKIPVLLPIHPRTEKMINLFNLNIPQGVLIVDPLGYLDFLKLEANSRAILTDSGGIQEEACILQVPCITLRENTERYETLKTGSNILAGSNLEKIISSLDLMLKREKNWSNPFGDGKSSKKIIDILLKHEN